MIDYKSEFEKLNESLDDEIFNIFVKLDKKGLTDPIVMGKDISGPVVHKTMKGVKISLNTVIENWWTKCNHIGVDVPITGPPVYAKRHLFIKGYQVLKHKYRLKPIHDIVFQEKVAIVEYLRTLV